MVEIRGFKIPMITMMVLMVWKGTACDQAVNTEKPPSTYQQNPPPEHPCGNGTCDGPIHMMELHRKSPSSINAWGFNHHTVNVLWADLSGISDNWDQEILFILDIADGDADFVANKAHPELVQFVTMQELSSIYNQAMMP